MGRFSVSGRFYSLLGFVFVLFLLFSLDLSLLNLNTAVM